MVTRAPNAPRPVIAVVGPATCDDEQARLARAVGQGIAGRGGVLLCGGGGGVAQTAAAAARSAGGLTIGLLPGPDAGAAPPADYLDVALPTGLGEGRDQILITAASGIIAIGGGFGTLAEIGLALRARKPIVLLASWRFELDEVKPQVPRASSGEEAVGLLWSALGARSKSP